MNSGAGPATSPVLSTRQLAAYGLLGLPLAATALPIYVHLPNLYGGLLGMNLALLGAVLLVARLADAIIDPLLGALADRLQRPRPLIAAGIALLACGTLLAFNPPSQPEYLWAWLAFALVPLYLGYSLAMINHLAWGSVLGATPHERTRVAAWREGLGLAGVIAASVLPMLLAPRIDTGLARYSLVLVIAATLCAAITLGFAPAPPTGGRPASPSTPGRGAMRRPFANPRFARLFAIFVVNGVAAALPATLVLFFIDDVLGLAGDAGLFLAAYVAAGAAGLPLWLALSRRIGKEPAWLAAMLLAVAAFAFAFMLGQGDFAGFLLVCILSGLALGADLVLPAALLADAINGGRDEHHAGAYAGLWNFTTKLNLALAAGLALPLLQFSGYRPGETDTAPLYWAYCLLPCLLKLIAAAMLAWRKSSTPLPMEATS